MISIWDSKVLRTLLSLTCLSAWTVGAAAQSFPVPQTKVELVAEENSLVPGRTVWIGLLFDLDKGWHTYWVNPGDAGAPPRVQWELPSGFRAGDIRWPVPTRLATGTLVDYGYEGRVMLAMPLQVPASYNPGTPATLAADVRYMVCREVCIPARAHPTLTIPSRSGPTSDAAARRELFAKARDQWPKAMPSDWKAHATDQGDHLVLSIETGSRESQAAFFPLRENEIDNASSQTVTPTNRGVQISLNKSSRLTGAISVLHGVVVLAPSRIIEIAAPVSRRR